MTNNRPQYNARFFQKHDVERNWERAINFYPLKGEIIIYDPDYDEVNNPTGYTYPRIKVGLWDGREETKTPDKLVKNLPFASKVRNVEFDEETNELNIQGKLNADTLAASSIQAQTFRIGETELTENDLKAILEFMSITTLTTQTN